MATIDLTALQYVSALKRNGFDVHHFGMVTHPLLPSGHFPLGATRRAKLADAIRFRDQIAERNVPRRGAQ